MHANCLTPKPLGVIFITPGIIFFNTQRLSLIRLRTGVEASIPMQIINRINNIGTQQCSNVHDNYYIYFIWKEMSELNSIAPIWEFWDFPITDIFASNLPIYRYPSRYRVY